MSVAQETCITVILQLRKNAVCAIIVNVIIEPCLGLRDRKRLETRLRLEDAAVTLVLRDGLDHTTVDAISELADVSPRTFFNYFDSKDAAILGLRQVEIAATELHGHCDRVAEHGLIDSVIHLLLTVIGPPSTRPTMKQDRLEIVRRHPQLLTTQLAQFTQLTTEVTGAVAALVARDVRFASDSPAELAASAELVLALCGGAVRVAVKEWAEAEADGAADQLESRAISLAREVTEKLS
ncbi:TetR/AcrR family transcriptional regulator [Cryobacterium luteum]|uniref:TetR/AcrR family transcriptional regulator n=1 Tax=Cryobacterium luteum TaxID=1424661 RepID=A0A5F0D1C9_9MICO|nr:TetR/AcrR family transcriptional regulator [Cryobacterium luteum]